MNPPHGLRQSDKENNPFTGHLQDRGESSLDPSFNQTKKRKANDTAEIFSLGPKKRPARTDPLVHHGRHFGRTVRAFCRIQALIREGLAIAVQLDLEDLPEEALTAEERREYQIYKQLLALSPKLEERLYNGSEQEVYHIADMISKGSANARSDDTRALKSAVVDWITPRGEVLVPPLQRNVKADRGYHHNRTGELLCPATMDWQDSSVRERLRSGELVPAGDQWPLFLFQGNKFDPEDPWKGLLRGPLLINAFKYIFTSPSSVERTDHRATRCSNSRIHGMSAVTIPSIAYIATQVRKSLPRGLKGHIFSRSDTITDSERFYNSLISLMEDPEEQAEVKVLLRWWDSQIFPLATAKRSVSSCGDTVYAKIKEKRRKESQARSMLEVGSGNSLQDGHSPGDSPHSP
ncbi:hypothetical protein BKA70DRAFT_1444974 [Coprinopsis sp. MPI-PUGE-AT-0042]|nr:hypothetical protein BKA70DRAFT_1444974 [Coprinopsis sp. MPI-PUGE-AT-0042]